MPTGSEMPLCWSTTYSCGMSCSSSWSRPSDTARATSFTRATSSAVTSSPDTATTPGEVRAETCSPAMPHVTMLTLTPAMRSASRIAATIDRLVRRDRARPRFDDPGSRPLTAPARGRPPSHHHLAREAGVELHVGTPLRGEILRHQHHRPYDLRPRVAPQQHAMRPDFQEHATARERPRAGDGLK